MGKKGWNDLFFFFLAFYNDLLRRGGEMGRVKYLITLICIFLIVIFTKIHLDDIKKVAELNKELENVRQELDYKNSSVDESKKDYINTYSYKEHEVQTLVGLKWYSGEMPLKMFPYSDAENIAEGIQSNVDVITVVTNKEGEDWALVEVIEPTPFGENTYGYIKVEYVDEAKDSSYPESSVQIPINIKGVTIGDISEKVIAHYGRDYIELNGFDGGFLHYGGAVRSEISNNYTLRPGIDIFIDRQNKKVWGLRVEIEGYNTGAGFGVGSNALEAVNYYKKLFPMNIEKRIDRSLADTTFDLGNGYFMEFILDTDELNANSIITRITIQPISSLYG